MKRFARFCVVGCFGFASLGHVADAFAAISVRIDRVSLLGRAAASAAAWNSSTDTYSDDYIHPQSWAVDLNGCGSRIDGVPIEGSSLPGASWLLEPLDRPIAGTPIELVGEPGSCRATAQLPALGRWRITLIVGPDAAGAFAHATKETSFNDVLVVALGDSFASGEGNPGTFQRWVDAQCHRSEDAWPERLARSLENDSTSVTFLSLACSGAGVEHLTDLAYSGIAPDGQAPLAPQVLKLRSMLGDPLRSSTPGVDLLLASVGINALNVGGTLVDCAADLLPGGIECQRDYARAFDKLAGLYDELSLSLSANVKLLGDFHLIQMPSRIMTDANDEYPKKIFGLRCSLSPTCTTSATFCGAFAGMRVQDKQWITKMVDRMNEVLADAAKRHGWILTPTKDLFRHHGYCSLPGTTWFRSLAESVAMQHNEAGTAHPNASGHTATYRAVARQVRLDLTPEAPAPTRLAIQFVRLRVTPEPHPEVRRDLRPHWMGDASVGVMRRARSDCGTTGFVELTGRIDRDGWTDLTTKPCMRFTLQTQGNEFVVRAFTRIQGLPPGNIIQELRVERFHLRSDRYNATTDPPGPAVQPRQLLTVTMKGYGTFEIEYTITKLIDPPVRAVAS